MPADAINTFTSLFKNAPLHAITFCLYMFSLLFGAAILNIVRRILLIITFVSFYNKFTKKICGEYLVPIAQNYLLNHRSLIQLLPNEKGDLWLDGFLNGVFWSLYIGIFAALWIYTTAHDAHNR